MRYLELLAPARDEQTGRTAVDFGADALYIGGARFGARRAAANPVQEIARLVEYAHAYGVKVYATLNTVIFEQELADARNAAIELSQVGVDALIVQDMAFTRMDLPIALHASTQTCNTTAEGILFLEKSGFSRVILERGLTLAEIEQIRSQTSVELEAFVHGAICVGHSGQCYLSRTMGTRSGNRGDCMQACRMSYDLVDDNGQTIIRGKHLLSVNDLNLSSHIGQLIGAGVNSFKIEGRLKDATYIKNVVGHYRKVLDHHIAADKNLARSSAGHTIFDFSPAPERTFSRSGSSYFIDGKHSGVASFDTPKAMGSHIGEVTSHTKYNFTLPENTLSAGDGICFIDSFGKLMGTNINRVEGTTVFPNHMDGIEHGTEIYRNYDHRFSTALENSRTRRVIDVDAEIAVAADKISIRLTDQTGIVVELTKEQNFEQAQNPEKMAQTLLVQIAKSGDTIFRVQNINIAPVSEHYFVPMSVINTVRRDALEKLRTRRIEEHRPPDRAAEELTYQFPRKELEPQMNVTNSLSERFYRDHGVTEIAPGLDMNQSEDDFDSERVMISSYCLRREIGECLLEKPTLRSELYLQRAYKRYKLEFDCKKCQMHLKYMK